MDKTYIEFVCDFMEKQEIGKPIYISKISNRMVEAYNMPLKKASGVVSATCRRILNENKIPELRLYRKGIYYRSAVTVFGEREIDDEQLIADKYLKNHTGYETGLYVIYKLGLTTQIPNQRVLVTNRVKKGSRKDHQFDIVVCSPKTEVNEENKYYLQILDVLEFLDDAPVDAGNPYTIIAEHMERLGLDYEKLQFFASRYYNRKTMLQLEKTAGSRLNSEKKKEKGMKEMAVVTYNDYLRELLKDVSCVLAYDTAADYLGLTNGGYRNKVQIFVVEEQPVKGTVQIKISSFEKKLFENKGGLFCTTVEQTLIDLLEQNGDEQIITESFANYYYNHGESFGELEIPEHLQEHFDKYSEWAKVCYEE